FLKPSFSAGASWIARLLPSFWFFALFQELNGTAIFAFSALATRALWALPIAVTITAITFGLAFRRNMRRIVEQPDIAPADRSRPATRMGSYLAARFLGSSLERAIVLFTARGIARSRQHRLLLAFYSGVGLAIALAYARDLIYPSDPMGRLYRDVPWNQVNAPFLVGTLVLLFFAVIGTRAVCTMPIALKANWIFRLTAVHSPSAYFAAVRKSLFALTAIPIWTASAIILIAIWPVHSALGHVLVLVVVGIVLIELSLYRFRKIPFACSYLPGKANLHVRLGAGGIGFLFGASIGVAIEYAALQRLAGFVVLLGILSALAVWAWRRRREFANLPTNRIQFEDLPPEEVLGLDLGGFGTPSDEVYVDTPDSPPAFRFEQFWQDLRYGSRILTRSPGFSAAAVALIALGIGGNAAIYSMIHSVLTKPAPGVRADGLVTLGIMIDGHLEFGNPSDSYINYLDYAAETRTLQSIAAMRSAPRFTLGLANGTYEVRGQLVSGNYLDTLGVPIVRGRQFTLEEERGVGPLPAIIAWHVWQNQFQGAESAIGQAITLNGHPAIVVGVSAPHFAGPNMAPNLEVSVPLTIRSPLARSGMELENRGSRGVEMIGRLARRATLTSAQAEFDTISRRLETAYPQFDKGRKVVLAPYSATAFGPPQNPQIKAFMGILIAVALVTLLIVCANVANLMLARAAVRQREMAVRQSLGASSFRILSITLAEGLVLSAAASVVAWLFAMWACAAVVKFVPALESGTLLEPDLSPDWQVAAYAMLLAVVATLTFTLVPAVRTCRQELLPWLKSGEAGVIQGRSRLANVLVVAQLAMCCLLLTSAGLAWRSINLMDTADLYFNKDHLLLAGVSTAGSATGKQQNLALLERMRRRLGTLPQVTAVSYSWATPPRAMTGMKVAAAGSTQQVSTDGNYVGPDYLEALGVPILAGRGIREIDMAGGTPSVVVNQKLAQALWPGQSALGQTLTLDEVEQPLQVIGIVPNGAFSGIGAGGAMTGIQKENRGNFVFLAEQLSHGTPGEMTFQVRYTGNLKAVAPAIRTALHETDSRVPVFSLQTMETAWNAFSAPVHLMTTLLELFGLASLLLASVGLYAVAAFYTARRTREFGIRMALGASQRQTLTSVLQEGLLLTTIGVGIGLALSAAAGKAFGSMLFGVTATDKPTYLAVIGLLLTVSLLACYIPARRASRIDPTRALRQD
ncbi:MAG TPA: ABC transporter permease, partial [Bryobacteraceae bacterium]